MLWTTNCAGRRGAHEAPVENAEGDVSRKANKRQTLFSPIVRYWFLTPLDRPGRHGGYGALRPACGPGESNNRRRLGYATVCALLIFSARRNPFEGID